VAEERGNASIDGQEEPVENSQRSSSADAGNVIDAASERETHTQRHPERHTEGGFFKRRSF